MRNIIEFPFTYRRVIRSFLSRTNSDHSAIILLINHELNNRLTGLVPAKLTKHRGKRTRGQANLINTFDPC